MGYRTFFDGQFVFDKPLDLSTYTMLRKLSKTRRMKRDISGYGIEGEFYAEDDRKGVLDPNQPPSPQPGLWCDWTPTEDGTALQWSGNESFYDYVKWLQYLVDRVLAPRGYTITGKVEFQGEESKDHGTIVATENTIAVVKGSSLVGHA